MTYPQFLNAACILILVLVALVYTGGIKKNYAQFECHAGWSLAACDWLEEQ